MGRGVERHAEAKLREADRWWASFEFAVHQARLWLVRWGARHDLLGPGNRYTLEARERYENAMESINICYETARGADTMARIYYEELEGRET